MSFYMFVKKTLGKLLLHAVYRCHVSGKENIPESGGVIVASNHISMRDVIIISAASDRQIFYMAKKELFKLKILARLFRSLGAYPVDRGSGTQAVKHSVELLKEDKAVGIFPQGTRRMKVNPTDTKIHSGVGMLQVKSGCPVVPVSIKTANYKIIPFFRKTELIIGKPMTSADFSDIRDDENRYSLVSERIFSVIVAQAEQGVVKSDK